MLMSSFFFLLSYQSIVVNFVNSDNFERSDNFFKFFNFKQMELPKLK